MAATGSQAVLLSTRQSGGVLRSTIEFCSSASLAIRSWMQVKDLVHDFPLAADLEHREQVCESVASPVVEFDSYGGDRSRLVDVCDLGTQSSCRAIPVVPGKKLLDWTVDQIRAEVSENRRIFVKGGPHVVSAA